ncbi:UNVERIFIED_CONTAM: hypothetical protein FKN15_008875 [Acipenser sinensis]
MISVNAAPGTVESELGWTNSSIASQWRRGFSRCRDKRRPCTGTAQHYDTAKNPSEGGRGDVPELRKWEEPELENQSVSIVVKPGSSERLYESRGTFPVTLGSIPGPVLLLFQTLCKVKEHIIQHCQAAGERGEENIYKQGMG